MPEQTSLIRAQCFGGGASCITETRQDRIKDQIQVLEDHPQIWHTVTQNSSGSITNRQGNGDRFLAEGHREEIEKSQKCVGSQGKFRFK